MGCLSALQHDQLDACGLVTQAYSDAVLELAFGMKGNNQSASVLLVGWCYCQLDSHKWQILFQVVDWEYHIFTRTEMLNSTLSTCEHYFHNNARCRHMMAGVCYQGDLWDAGGCNRWYLEPSVSRGAVDSSSCFVHYVADITGTAQQQISNNYYLRQEDYVSASICWFVSSITQKLLGRFNASWLNLVVVIFCDSSAPHHTFSASEMTYILCRVGR